MTLEEFYKRPPVVELKQDFKEVYNQWLTADDVELLDIEEDDGKIVKRTEKQDCEEWMNHFIRLMALVGWDTIPEINKWYEHIKENGFKDLLD